MCKPVALAASVCRLAAARSGVTSLEYALMGSLIAVSIAVSVFGYSDSLGSLMSKTFEQIGQAM